MKSSPDPSAAHCARSGTASAQAMMPGQEDRRCRAGASWNVAFTFLLLAFLSTATAQSTNFNVGLTTLGEGVDDFKFSLDNGWAILFSLENVYYDEFYTCTPKQAFRVTDVNGDALQPFAIPARDPENYVLDMSFLKTGAGLKPYFRGDELSDSTLRAWRIDYHKEGVDSDVYTTVMSGVAVPIAERTYMLRVDLGLHWEIEGDAINRLQQGLNTHIALAIADFQSFTLSIDADEGGGSLVADVKTTTIATTAADTTTAEQASTTFDADTTTGDGVSSTTNPGSTTESTAYPYTSPPDSTSSGGDVSTSGTPAPPPTYAPTGATPIPVTDGNDDVGRETEAPPPPPATTPALPKDTTPTAVGRNPAECEHHLYGKNGKAKKAKKEKKGKKSKKGKEGKLSPYEECLLGKGKKGKKHKHGAFLSKSSKARRSGFIAVTAIVFLIMGTAVTLVTKQTQKAEWQYEAIDMKLNEPNFERGPVAPIPLRAFGTFPKGTLSTSDLDDAVASMRMPPARQSMAIPAWPIRTGTSKSSMLGRLSPSSSNDNTRPLMKHLIN